MSTNSPPTPPPLPPQDHAETPRHLYTQLSGTLDKRDKIHFKSLLLGGLKATNKLTRLYPAIEKDEDYMAISHTSEGQLILRHLTAVMYTFWDCSPPICERIQRSTVFETLVKDFAISQSPAHSLAHAECRAWGAQRLTAAPFFYILEGSVVTDDRMSVFFRVLSAGNHSLADIAKEVCGQLPARISITALPFKGVLVWDGIFVSYVDDHNITKDETDLLYARLDKARKDGSIVTGSETKMACSVAHAMTSATSKNPIQRPLCEEELKMIKVITMFEKVDETVYCRGDVRSDSRTTRFIWRGQNVGSFDSEHATPTHIEILRAFIKMGEQGGDLPRQLLIEELTTAQNAELVCMHAGVYVSFYPPQSTEERMLLNEVELEKLEELAEICS